MTSAPQPTVDLTDPRYRAQMVEASRERLMMHIERLVMDSRLLSPPFQAGGGSAPPPAEEAG